MHDSSQISFRQIATKDVELHVALAGPEDGPPVVLLHGFPELWYGWRHQIPTLAAAGYRVIVPDQRGYNLSEKPARVRDYATDILADDVVALLDALGIEKALVVGHDWGGGVSWTLGHRSPERLLGLAILNCPHTRVFQRTLLRSPRQLAKSWYMFALQIPWGPEALLGAKGAKRMSGALKGGARRGTFSADELLTYREAWSQPGALRGMINWYRAGIRYPSAKPAHPRIPVPTLVLWGEEDAFLGAEMAEASLAYCEDGQLEHVPGAGHFVQHEAPEIVSAHLLDFAGRLYA